MLSPSTRHPERLPGPAALERLSQSLAVLDAMLSPVWEERYYSFNRRWDEAAGERMGSMRNGEGDDYFILFSAQGAILKGLAHESAMFRFGDPLPGVLDAVPAAFAGFLREPAFDMDNTSFCLWHLGEAGWQRGPIAFLPGEDPDGSEMLLSLLGGDPADYQRFARDIFAAQVPLEAIARVYQHEPLSDALVELIAPGRRLVDLADDLDEIGYPSLGPM